MIFGQPSFHQALLDIGVKPQYNIFREIVTAYSSTNRHYHNHEHIDDCLQHLTEYQHLATHPAEITIAFYFHDIVYLPHKDNEKESADRARDYLESENADKGVIDRIESLILATKDHYAHTSDEQLLVDIDLSIFGAPSEKFSAYDRAIRQEYNWLNDTYYQYGRKMVLKKFLERDCIYQLPSLRQAWEANARTNLELALEQLSNPTYQRQAF